MRYRAAVGVGEEAHSRQRNWCPWSKPVNVETWGHVLDPIVMAHTFAELGKGTLARERDHRFRSGRNFLGRRSPHPTPHPLRTRLYR